jgi:FixJ family two-component response regulator
MPEFDGLALQRALLERGRDEQVVFITGDGDIPTCAHAMKAGAVDFLQKPFGDDDLLAAVERALGRSRTQWARKMESESACRRVSLLTPREFQVFERVITGMLNKQIAAELGTALKTVKVQRGRVMEKMGVVSVAELVRVAQEAGVLSAGGS